MKIGIDVGCTIYNQSVELVARRATPQEPWVFDIVKHAAGQRDDTDTIHNLPADVIEAMARAVADVKKFGA